MRYPRLKHKLDLLGRDLTVRMGGMFAVFYALVLAYSRGVQVFVNGGKWPLLESRPIR